MPPFPDTLLEAAYLDGAGEWGAFFLIGLPLGYPGVVTALMLSFMDGWNSLEQPITYLKTKALWPLSLYLPNITEDKASVAFGAAFIACLLPVCLRKRPGGIGAGSGGFGSKGVKERSD